MNYPNNIWPESKDDYDFIINCPSCGEIVSQTDDNCPFCGEDLERHRHQGER